MGKLQIWNAVLRGEEYMKPIRSSEESAQGRAAGEDEHEEGVAEEKHLGGETG